MRIGYIVAVSVGFKAVLILLCFSLVCAGKLFGQSYFNPTLSASAYEAAVEAADNVDARNQYGDTGLMYAANQGSLPLAQSLINNGAHLNLQSTQGSYVGLADKINGMTALHYAVTNIRIDNNKKVAYYLINIYADPAITNAQKNTPLHLTVISTDFIPDRTAMVVALVKNGAPINAQNFQGETLMHLAANSKNPEWIKGIITNLGPLIDMSIQNQNGLTPVAYAKQLGFEQTTEALRMPIPSMPQANEYNPAGLTGLMLAVMKGDEKLIDQMIQNASALNMKSQDEYQNSALHFALIYDRLDIVKKLLDQGASLTIQNARGELPIHFLPRVRTPEMRRKIASLMLKKNPQLILSQNNQGENVLHYIVRYDNQELLSFLIENYLDLIKQALSVKNKALQSPLELATKMRRQQIAQQLQAVRTQVAPNTKSNQNEQAAKLQRVYFFNFGKVKKQKPRMLAQNRRVKHKTFTRKRNVQRGVNLKASFNRAS